MPRAADTVASPAGQEEPGRLSLLANPAFLTVWSVGAVASTIRWLEMLAVGVWAFDVTGSPFVTALMLILRMLPLALFGVLAGAAAERLNRQIILLVGFAAMAVTSMVLGTLARTGTLEVWHVGVGAFLNGLFWITDFPVRRTWLGEIAGPMRIGAAMSLDTVTNNGTRMLGPLLGGLLFELVGLDGTFILGALLYGVAFIATALLRSPEGGSGEGHPHVLHSVIEGLRHVRANRALAGVLMVTVVFNLWGFPFVSMIPVIGKEVLGLSAFPVGLLASAEGAGALIGALLVALHARIPYYRRLYVAGLATYLVMIVAFSHSPWAWLSGVTLIVAGLGAAGYAAMQSTLVLLNVPREVRGRMMGVLSVCIGVGPLGFLHLGALATWLGAPAAVAIIALEGIVALAVVVRLWPEVYQLQEVPR